MPTKGSTGSGEDDERLTKLRSDAARDGLKLSAALARSGYNPLSIDLDPQAHLSYVCGARVEHPHESIFSFFDQVKPLTQLIRPAHGGWLVIPAHFELSKVDTKFGKGPNVRASRASSRLRRHSRH